jgi:type I restriction enzyme, S subunit
MTDWPNITLGDFIALQRGHDLTESERRVGLVPVMGSAGQNGFHDTALAKGPGIVIGRSGASFGQVHFSPVDYWPHNTALYVTDFKGSDERFAFYFLKAIDFSGYNSGSAQPSLNRNFIYSIPVRIPPIAEQKAIAAMLGALDDKIELNRRMNATLEAMARALFQNWFVDATAAGLPKGWREESIYTAADVIYGAPFASAKFNKERIGKPLIRIRDLADESPEVFTLEEHPKGYLVKPGDIVVGMDGEFRAHLWGGEEAWLNQRVCVFAPKSGFSAPFILNSIVGLLAEVEATETATTVIHIGKNDIDRFRIIVPDEKTLDDYNRFAEPLFKRIVLNKQESRTLAGLRDTLLPKLLSGDLSVATFQNNKL